MSVPDIFISYSHEDHERVQMMADALAARGWNVWWDKGIRPGQNFRASIQDSLDRARCVVVVWSSHSVKSHWAIDEAESGRKRNILVPVVIEAGVEPPLGFGGIQTADLTAWLREPARDPSFERLCGDISALLRESEAVAREAAASAPQRPKQRSASPFKRRIWWVAAAVFLVAVLGILAVKFSGASTPSGVQGKSGAGNPSASQTVANPAGAGNPDTGNPGVPDGPVVDKVEYSIDDLRCVSPQGGGDEAGGALPDYSVDVTRHLLLDKEGNTVSAPTKTENAERLVGRRLVVVHTTSMMLEVGTTHFTHILITRGGAVRQLMPFDYSTNHAANSTWKGLPVNKYSLSIELENAGPAQYRDGIWYSWMGEVLPAAEIVRLRGDITWRGWHKFTDAQMSAFFNVACALRRAYPTITAVVGHGDIDTSVGDPGPLFPMEEMRAKLFTQKPQRDR